MGVCCEKNNSKIKYFKQKKIAEKLTEKNKNEIINDLSDENPNNNDNNVKFKRIKVKYFIYLDLQC